MNGFVYIFVCRGKKIEKYYLLYVVLDFLWWSVWCDQQITGNYKWKYYLKTCPMHFNPSTRHHYPACDCSLFHFSFSLVFFHFTSNALPLCKNTFIYINFFIYRKFEYSCKCGRYSILSTRSKTYFLTFVRVRSLLILILRPNSITYKIYIYMIKSHNPYNF